MSAVWGNTVRKQAVRKAKPYVVKVDAGTGAVYLAREPHPLYTEAPYLIALITAVLVALFSSCNYIQLRTDVECRIRRTETLERQYLSMKNDNTLLERMVYQTPDLNQIYETATTELGMIPATKENVRVFLRTNNEFVFQKDNIPSIGF
ncbi:MAG: hypothetical protein PHV18_09330 [Lachnospiraceae bacterium]|nr:hypothetical protein [Lachnospiraceae bacterium]